MLAQCGEVSFEGGRLGQGGLVGAYPGHAVFVDGQEQGVLAVGPFV